MAKTILAFSIAFFGALTVFASAAEACISCNYVPEVVNSPSKSYGAKRYKKQRVNRPAKKRSARPARKRIDKKKAIAKKVQTAKTTSVDKNVESENSTISKVSWANDEAIESSTKKVAKVKTDPVKANAVNENSDISTATLAKEKTIQTAIEAHTKDEPKVTRNIGCKKFFPTVGMTLTVPCE